MNASQKEFIVEQHQAANAPPSKELPYIWCENNIRLNEKDYRGPFSTIGREYLRFFVNLVADRDVSDITAVWGSQTLKTTGLMAKDGWAMKNDPCTLLWYFPTGKNAKDFSRRRYQKMIEESEVLAKMIPENRHKYNLQDMELGAAAVILEGTGSTANLKSTPARRINLDEVESFIEHEMSREADPLNLAEQRTKGQVNPQRWKTSTPSIFEGLIWQQFLKGSMHRYAGLCYHCQKKIILAWNPRFTILDKTGMEAYIVWDKEAKRENGTWDLDRVVKSARAVCPHCGGDNEESKKTLLVRNGEWIATNPGAPTSHISLHLPSMYSCLPETSYGNLAKKFIEAKHSLTGLQGFINGDLAEPYQSQDRLSERTELIIERAEVTAEWNFILTADVQARAPYFWFVKRAWNSGNSEGIECGPANSWDEIAALQKTPGATVKDVAVGIDARFGTRSEAEVLKECVMHGEIVDRANEVGDMMLPIHVGWSPMFGYPGKKRWKNDKGLYIPYFLKPTDPYFGTSMQNKMEMSMLEFAGDYFKDILDGFRRGSTKQGHDKNAPIKGFTWKVAPAMDNEIYWRHMDAEHKIAVVSRYNASAVFRWVPRHSHAPNHLFDCEVMQVVKAAFFEYFELP